MELLERLKEVCDQIQAANCRSEMDVLGWLSQNGITDAGVANAVLNEWKRRGGGRNAPTVGISFETRIGEMTSNRFPLVQVTGDGYLPFIAATDGQGLAIIQSVYGGPGPGKQKYFNGSDCKMLASARSVTLTKEPDSSHWVNHGRSKIVEEQHGGSFPDLACVLPDLSTYDVLKITLNAEVLLKVAKAITVNGVKPIVTLMVDKADTSRPIAVASPRGIGVVAASDEKLSSPITLFVDSAEEYKRAVATATNA